MLYRYLKQKQIRLTSVTRNNSMLSASTIFCAREAFRANKTLAVVAKQLRCARISVRHRHSQPSHTLRHFFKPVIFTVAVGGSAFVIAAVVDYEMERRPAYWSRRHVDLWQAIRQQPPTPTRLIELLKLKWNTLSDSQKLATIITAINFAVFVGWQTRSLQRIWNRHFLLSTENARYRPHSMLLSALSHSSFIHFAVNSYVLFSFCGALESPLGAPQSAALFVSGAAFSSLASYCRYMFKPGCSLGSSGGIFSLLAFTCLTYPTAELHIAFVDQIVPHSFQALPAFLGLVCLDLAGLALGWRTFDHAAHLGGALFGAAYMYVGARLYETHRNSIAKEYQRLKQSITSKPKQK